MEWLEVMKSPFPVVVVLGAGLAVVWRAYLGKDAALTESQNARIADLKEIVKESSRD